MRRFLQRSAAGCRLNARAPRLMPALHLAAEVGQNHRVLMVSARRGRREQFTEVVFVGADLPEAVIVEAIIVGCTDRTLIG